MTREQKARRDARIVRLHRHGEPLTKAEIARVIGISQAQVDRTLREGEARGRADVPAGSRE